MSAISLKVECSFTDAATQEGLYTLLNEYDYDAAVQENFIPQHAALEKLGTGYTPFYEDVANCQISEVEKTSGNGVSFYLEGGVLRGSDFWDMMHEMLISLRPTQLIAVEFNDQVGEWIIYAYDGKERFSYETGFGGDCDDEIYSAEDHDELLEIARGLLHEGRLVMPEESYDEYDEDDDYDMNEDDDEEGYFDEDDDDRPNRKRYH